MTFVRHLRTIVLALGALALWAPDAMAGDWNVTIGGGTSNVQTEMSGSTAVYYPTGPGATLSVGDLQTALATYSAVLVTTDDRGHSTGLETGALTVGAAIEGPGALELESAADTTFANAGSIGASTPLGSLSVTTGAGRYINIHTEHLRTTGDQTWSAYAVIGFENVPGPVRITSTASGDITFDSRVYAHAGFYVTTALPGKATFEEIATASGDEPGAAALIVEATAVLRGVSYSAHLNGMYFNGPVEIERDLTIGGGGTLYVSVGPVTGPHRLRLEGDHMIEARGSIDVAELRAVGHFSPVKFAVESSATIRAAGLIDVHGGDAGVQINDDATFESTGGGAVNLGPSVRGFHHLTVNTSGPTTIGAITSAQQLQSLTTDAGGTVTLLGEVYAYGSVTLRDSLTLTESRTITAGYPGVR